MLSQMAEVNFIWLKNIPLCTYIPQLYLFICHEHLVCFLTLVNNAAMNMAGGGGRIPFPVSVWFSLDISGVPALEVWSPNH